ncbi:MAG: hypothetical protein Q4F67_17575, partial [Propionibacteriaceae bacterium]|nr:hypothetical protein [Propionibacteriaceae bacterium]
YAPEDEPLPRPAPPAGKVSWLGGLAVIAAVLGTAGVTGGLLAMPADTVLAAATGAAGLALVFFALVARRRRMPRTVLALLVLPLAATGWLASQSDARPAFGSADTHLVRIVAQEATVDLRDLELSAYRTVRIEAIASDVEVLMPAPAVATSVTSWASDVQDLSGTGPGSPEPIDLELQVSATFSTVTIEDAS